MKPTIPDAAIEAAAEAFSVVRGTIDERAAAALVAAMPAIREHIAQELIANAETRKNEWESIAVRSAARVVLRGAE